MPMVWSAEADAKLMAKIIQVRDVKLDAAEMKEIAIEMGPECTPKAISHRMTHFRKLAGNGNALGKAEDGDEKPKKSTKAAKSNAAPKKNAQGRGKKAAAERTPSPGTASGDGQLTPPDTNRAKRAGSKRNYAEVAGEAGSDEEDVEGLDKKVKIEVGEDIGEGLRQGAEDDDKVIW